MATINFFQKYSQGENTVTNNVLLMLSMVYEINPRYYEEYINSLIEENEYYQVIPVFSQQFNNGGNGFIDGHIKLMASTIIIETKLSGLEWIQKLLKYTDSFSNEESKVLFHLSSIRYPESDINLIKRELAKSEVTKKVKFVSISYKDLVVQLDLLRNLYPYEIQLQKIFQQFDQYTHEMNLIPEERHILRAMACGQSFDLNIKHKFYFDLASRGYRNFDYIGIYSNKSVRYIGEVENMIVADYDVDTKVLDIYESTSEVTDNQKSRLIDAIEDSVQAGWNTDDSHRFFLLKNFENTNFVKVSSGGIMRSRYFYLEDEPGIKVESTKQIAKALLSQTWS